MMKLITSSKGAGLAIEGDWIFAEGQMPKREIEWLCWCPADDLRFNDFVAHCKTLI